MRRGTSGRMALRNRLFMPNDAKLGLVVGMVLVLLIALLFFRREGTSELPAAPAAPAKSLPPAPPPPPKVVVPKVEPPPPKVVPPPVPEELPDLPPPAFEAPPPPSFTKI